MSDLAKLGDLTFSVVSDEVLTFENTPSEYPLENGSSVTDHVQKNPTIVVINGNIVGKDAAKKHDTLRKYSLNHNLLKYVGRIIISNCIIINYTRNVDSEIANGFNFDITLQKLEFARKELVTINTRNLKIPDIEKPKESLQKTRSKSSKKNKKGRKSKSPTTRIKVDNSALNNRIKELTGY